MSSESAVPPRAHLPVRVFRLGEEPSDDLSSSTTAEERFEMVATLTARMQEFYPSPLVSSPRRGIPVVVVQR